VSDALTNDELRDEYQFDYSQAKPNRFAAKAAGRPATGFNPTTADSLRKLREAATAFAKGREVAEAKVGQTNPVIAQLRRAGMLASGHEVVGPVVHSTTNDEVQAARYYAAGIRGDGGVGAFTYQLGFGEEPNTLTAYQFVSFADCPLEVQSALAGQVDGLLSQLMAELRVPA
jgi:hypothetical protein